MKTFPYQGQHLHYKTIKIVLNPWTVQHAVAAGHRAVKWKDSRDSGGIAGRIQTDLALKGLVLHPVKTNISNGFAGAGLGPCMGCLLTGVH